MYIQQTTQPKPECRMADSHSICAGQNHQGMLDKCKPAPELAPVPLNHTVDGVMIHV